MTNQMTDAEFIEFVKAHTQLVRTALELSFQLWKRVSSWCERQDNKTAWSSMMAFGREADNLGANFDEMFAIERQLSTQERGGAT